MDTPNTVLSLKNKFELSTKSLNIISDSYTNTVLYGSIKSKSSSLYDNSTIKLSPTKSIYLEDELSKDFSDIENAKTVTQDIAYPETGNTQNAASPETGDTQDVAPPETGNGDASPLFNPILPEPTITVSICLYYINEMAVNPFFEYLFTWNEETKQAEFPKKSIDLQIPSLFIHEQPPTPRVPQTSSNSRKIPTTPVKTQIMNECIDFIVELFQLHEVFNTTRLKEMFNGFIWVHESNTIYMFFNVFDKRTALSKIDETTPHPLISASTKAIDERTNGANREGDDRISQNGMKDNRGSEMKWKKTYKWAILDEIINKQYIATKNAPILPEIVKMFKENTFLKTLHTTASDNSLRKIPLEYPLSLYLCDGGAEGDNTTSIEWKNVVATEDEDEYFIENTVNYSLLGDFYYFSSEAIETVDVMGMLSSSTSSPASSHPWEEKNFKRYAVFLNVHNGEYTIEESYIVKDTSTITKEQWEQYYSKTDPANVSTIWFKDKGLQLWGVKYPAQFYRVS